MKPLILQPTTQLERRVASWVRSLAADYDGDLRGPLKDLFYGGSESGMVDFLIYYQDSCAFFRRYRKDITALLTEILADQGTEIDVLFGEKWDATDPLATKEWNQNLLAWFGFETAARNLADRAGYDD